MVQQNAAVVSLATAAARRAARRPPAPTPPAAPLISNARIAVVVVLIAEWMFFAGLISAYIIFRGSSPAWPPPNLPRLPLAVTWANTVVLLASAVTMLAARRAVRRDDQPALRRQLLITGALGLLFVTVQGVEWVRLVHHGLTLSTGMYGATFYTLIGTHAAHVVAAVLWVGVVAAWAWRGRLVGGDDTAVDACTIYWIFVCALWLVLFAMVYQ